MKWILLQKWSRFVPFFFTPFLELNLLLENNSVLLSYTPTKWDGRQIMYTSQSISLSKRIRRTLTKQYARVKQLECHYAAMVDIKGSVGHSLQLFLLQFFCGMRGGGAFEWQPHLPRPRWRNLKENWYSCPECCLCVPFWMVPHKTIANVLPL